MIILIDNYDSFTFNIYHYITENNLEVKVFRNNKITVKEVLDMKPEGIVISPGPKTPNEAGICLKLIKDNTDIPLLGICLGHQSIAQAYGGKVIQSSEIMHGKIDNIFHKGHKLFNEVEKKFSATRYHSLIVQKSTLPKDFNIIAETKNRIIMAIAHNSKKVFGLQFHPESIGTECGKKIIKNFIKILND